VFEERQEYSLCAGIYPLVRKNGCSRVLVPKVLFYKNSSICANKLWTHLHTPLLYNQWQSGNWASKTAVHCALT